MREILFRGKSDLLGWIEGWYCPEVKWGERYFPVTITHKTKEGWLDDVAVIPETVGQYTGLTDKNGVKIFEGDIVRYTERRFNGEDFHVAHVVKFEEGGFTAHNYFLNRWLLDWAGGSTQLEGIEVIGNIHDNPELIGRSENNA